ncbi:hypothetical protein JMJ77_0008506 [Colletotrichum scovillei]|uniref:Uncharacterized protein n=1 Tax=Colletotrichum scovillei TaxID=1209932 RepID=A0A9P7REI9_9PEZI|nr:hypothetical protein JMJ77_0008506 [Colletotrichum scovillei]KAG7075502.1 hypothetical protein JMJ76_0011962 [Colletotrichum scovillei]KAG7082653.1 hypothetical protein JMJ78_0004754 [Colletotrichum scovillei]
MKLWPICRASPHEKHFITEASGRSRTKTSLNLIASESFDVFLELEKWQFCIKWGFRWRVVQSQGWPFRGITSPSAMASRIGPKLAQEKA